MTSTASLSLVGVLKWELLGPSSVQINSKPELSITLRLSQTLIDVRSLMWIVVEDGNRTSPLVSRLLNRTGIPHLYEHVATEAGYPGNY